MHCKIPVQTCDMSEQILFHTEQLVSETKSVNYHSKVCVCVRVRMGLCVSVSVHIYNKLGTKSQNLFGERLLRNRTWPIYSFPHAVQIQINDVSSFSEASSASCSLDNKTVTVLAERGHDAPRARDKKARARGAMAKGTRMMKTPPTHIRSTITLTSPHLYSHTS